jgi:predicted dehydrogenase
MILGAGNRGMDVYAAYAKAMPKMLRIVAVAEPDDVKRRRVQADHSIPSDFTFNSWEDAFVKPPDLDAVIITTQDQMHAGPLAAAMKLNVNILCEKPIVPTLEECRAIEKASANFTKVFVVGHVLKYTAFFSKIKELLDTGRIGRLIGIDLIEHVGHIHISHSFVRGNWRKLAESSPMILAKSCHDMDMLNWLAGSPCESLSSYGALNYFKAENAPAGAPARCLDGCPAQLTCPYHVSKIYLTPKTTWPTNVITTDLSMAGRVAALETGPYGRCVFHCDNDVVDHETVSMKFKNGVSATFTMSGFTMETHRSVALFGTAGEIKGDMEAASITLSEFSSRNVETIALAAPVSGHSGGDANLITDFVSLVRGDKAAGRSTVKDTFESHYMAFAAEASRLDGAKTIDVQAFRRDGR